VRLCQLDGNALHTIAARQGAGLIYLLLSLVGTGSKGNKNQVILVIKLDFLSRQNPKTDGHGD
jgi:hypothetical protein